MRIREGRHNFGGKRPEDLPVTKRHLEMLTLFEQGLTYVEVAKMLGISRNTVLIQTHKVFDRLRAKNMVHAVAIAIRRCLI
jgi:DNA-binding CsgD family transcriptional regulator